jgi:cellulose synthase/poly-beta-1,6-N-acetylglucosamine synthase-like glycosyltransferase
VHAPHPILFAIYLVLGPGAWVIMHALLQLGRSRLERLRQDRSPLPENPPHVTILVPAKDEGEKVRDCINAALVQDYPSFDIVAIDDRSTDVTGTVLDELASAHPQKLKTLHVSHEPLPAGWVGKTNALHTGVQHARGAKWLLLLDSDVIAQPEALTRTIALAEARKYDMISLLTRLECHTFWERLLIPLAAGAWSVMHAVSLTNNDNSKVALGNGQFFVVRRSAYDAIGGHVAVRDQTNEDVGLTRLLKGRGFKVRLYRGAHLAATRMYSSLPGIVRGWARIYAGCDLRWPWRIAMTMAFIMLCGLSVYPALALGIYESVRFAEHAWLFASLAHFALMTAYLAMMYFMSGNRMRDALLFPLSAAMQLYVFAVALRMCRTGKVTWRGTSYETTPTVAQASRTAS